MFKRVLVDCHAEIDLPKPPYYLYNTIEGIASKLEWEAKDLTAFLKDHRSREAYEIYIIREYRVVCSFCGSKEERDNDAVPVCCQKAIDEDKAQKQPKCVSG